MSTLSRILARVTLDSRDFTAEVSKIKAQTASLSKETIKQYKDEQLAFTRYKNSITAKARDIKNVGLDLSTALTLPIGGGALLGLNAYKEYDSLTKALNTQEKSAQSLAKRLEELRLIAKQPGIGFQEAIQGDVRLRAVGISAKQSAKILKEFANAIAQTGGGKAELNSVTVQLGQMAAKGKVFAQDLKPIIEAAPVVGGALAEMYGTVDSESIQSILTNAGKNSKQFIDDLLGRLEKMPRVAGGYKNATENMRDAIFQFGKSIGATIDKSLNLTDRLNGLSERIISLGRSIESLPPGLQKIIVGMGGTAAAAGPVLFSFGKIAEMLSPNGSLSKGAIFVKNILSTVFRSVGSFKGIGNAAKVGGIVAILTIAYKTINAIVKESSIWVNDFKKLYNESVAFKAVIDGFLKTVTGLKDLFELVLTIVKSIGNAIDFIAGAGIQLFRDLGNIVKGVFGGDTDFGRDRFKESNKAANDFLVTWRKLIYGIKDTDLGVDNVSEAVRSMNAALKSQQNLFVSKTPVIAAPEVKTDKIKDALNKYNSAIQSVEVRNNAFGKSFDPLNFKLDATQSAMNELIEIGTKKALSYIPKLTAEFNQLTKAINDKKEVETVTTNITDFKKEYDITDKLLSGFGNMSERVGEKIKAVKGLISNLATSGLDIPGQVFEKLNGLVNQLSQSLEIQVGKWKGLIKENGVIEWTDNLGNKLDDFNTRLKNFTLDKMKGQLTGINPLIKGFGDNVSNVYELIASKFESLPEVFKKLGEQISELVGNVTNLGFGIANQSLDNREKRLDQYYEKEKSRIENSTLLEEQKADAIKRLDADVAKKKRKIARDQAVVDKISALFSATVNGANAIISSLSRGPIAAGIVSALVAAQIATIAAAPIPALAEGGLVYGKTLAMVGDNPNAFADPEVITPLSKLEPLLGRSQYAPEVIIRGGDMKIVSDYNVMMDKRLR